MASLKLRDRDSIITKEGLIFRVFGYSHPSNAYVCDAEYAPASIFASTNLKASRGQGEQAFCKFYEDEGWKLIHERFPQHTIFHEMLQRKVVGVRMKEIEEVRKPKARLAALLGAGCSDELLKALQNVLQLIEQNSGLSTESFGVFGSLLHGFHHPKLSDIDLIIYGKKNLYRLYESLHEIYSHAGSSLENEFAGDSVASDKPWRFRNLSPKEFAWHQRRKLIYGLSKTNQRAIKTEFEPVKEWSEIASEYDSEARIIQKGWAKLFARVTDGSEGPFIPSVYRIEPLNVLEGVKGVDDVERVVSYVEEFRMQATKDEKVYIEGQLEEFRTRDKSFHQVALSYCPRYYEQIIKVTH